MLLEARRYAERQRKYCCGVIWNQHRSIRAQYYPVICASKHGTDRAATWHLPATSQSTYIFG